MTMIRRIIAYPVTRLVLFFGLYATLMGGGIEAFSSLYHGNSDTPAVNTLGAVFSSAAAMFSLWVMTRFADKRSWTSTGYAARGVVSETLAGYLIGMALLSVVVGVMATLGAYHFIKVNPRFTVVLPLALCLFVAISEETLFRGYFFQTLETRWGTGIALTVTSLFFGLAHLINPVAGITRGEKMFSAICIVFEAGILLGAAYVATRRLWLPIGLHWAWNFFEGPFYGTKVSGETLSSSYIVSKTSGPFLLTGGVFGPEGSLVCLIVCTIAGVLLLRIAVKNGRWQGGHALPSLATTEPITTAAPSQLS